MPQKIFGPKDTVRVKAPFAKLHLSEADQQALATIIKIENRRHKEMLPLVHLRFPSGNRACIFVDAIEHVGSTPFPDLL